jgi:hypothetical protein
MQRPDLDALTCVNPECQHFCCPGAANLTVRKMYGYDRIRAPRKITVQFTKANLL